MNAIERLKSAMVRVKSFLDGLADRDISLKEVATETEIEMAKESIIEQEAWIKGYDKGYEKGRDGEVKRVREIINRYLT